MRVGRSVAFGLVGMTAIAAAQTVPCEPCTRGNALLDATGDGSAELRAAAPLLESFQIDGPEMSQQQAGRMLDWRSDVSAALDATILQLDTRSHQDLDDMAAALCGAPDGSCVRAVSSALYCATGRCAVTLPSDLHPFQGCDPYVVEQRSPSFGAGLEYATGWQDSAAPTDHRAWSLSIEARKRLIPRLGLVARVGGSTGRDAAEDADGDGRDDRGTGAITRWSALAGPSLLVSRSEGRDAQRYLEVDALAGYVATSRTDEDGVLFGLDTSYQVAILRAGVRLIQGVGPTQDARAVLAHVGIVVGSGPSYSYGAGCGGERPSASTALAFALDIPLSGFASDLGYVAPGFGAELVWHMKHRWDVVAHGDLLVFPSGDRDRVLQQTLLAGARFDMSRDAHDMNEMRKGIFVAVTAGYAFASAPSSSQYRSAPMIDGAIGYIWQGADGAFDLRVHSRHSLVDEDVMIVFASAGIELRLDHERWADRR